MIWEIFPAPAKLAGSLGNSIDQAATVVADANKNSKINKTFFSRIFLFDVELIIRRAENRKRAGPKKTIASYDLVRAIAAKIISTESRSVIFSFNNTERQ